MKKIIGLERGRVRLSPYNPRWKKLYEQERKRIVSVIGGHILDIQHVGSTSIPGVKAKPIIDIAIGVRDLKTGRNCIKPLEELGYEYKHDAGIKGRHFFAKGSEKNRTYYVHVEKLNGQLWKNHILFRDYLRAHKQAVREYNKIKEGLAEKYKDDRDSYSAEKNSFIEEIIRKAERNR
ncbi:MAG: GrpB family protein [Candidatus Nealsonbacteria bacterium]|nr:GrpB family protein [Candidatus Nealsonbacteria bacterium]